jgi:hypothetical protein
VMTITLKTRSATASRSSKLGIVCASPRADEGTRDNAGTPGLLQKVCGPVRVLLELGKANRWPESLGCQPR